MFEDIAKIMALFGACFGSFVSTKIEARLYKIGARFCG
jgi:hypothetical protein